MTQERDWTSAAMDRRRFLQLCLASVACPAAAGVAHAEERAREASQGRGHFGAMQELAAGAVQPEGWLREYMSKQRDELGSKLPEISWPFTEAYWSGLETGESWWPWEQKAYWIDGATRLALVMQDEVLFHRTQAILGYTSQHADADGYLGPQFFKDPKGDEHRWPQNIFFRALMASAEAGVGPPDIAEAMRRHYLGDKASYGLPERNIANVEPMLWSYAQTRDARLLALAESSWAEYLHQETTAKPRYGDLSELRVYAATPIDAHGVTYAEISKIPALLYLHTGKPEYLRFAQAAQDLRSSHAGRWHPLHVGVAPYADIAGFA